MPSPRRYFALLIATVACVACDGSPTGEPSATGLRLEIVTGDMQSTTVMTELPEPLVVRLVDARGHPVSGRSVDFRVVAGDGLVEFTAGTTASNGLAQARWKLGRVARDTQRVEASVMEELAGEAADIVIFRAVGTAAPPAEAVGLSEDEQSAPAGTPLPEPLRLRITDEFDNGAPGVRVAWSVRAGGGSLSADTTRTDSDGIASVEWTLGSKAGEQRVEAVAEEVPSPPALFTVTATAGEPAIYVVTAQNTTPTVGEPVEVVAQLADAAANPVETAGRVVAWTVSGGGHLSASSSTTDAHGRAMTSLIPSAQPGVTHYVTAQDQAGATGSSDAIVTGASPAVALAVVQQPSAQVDPGVVLPVQPIVQLVDASGVPVAQPNVSVAASIATGTGALSGSRHVSTDESGAASFLDLAIDGHGPHRLLFSTPGLASDTSDAIQVGASEPIHTVRAYAGDDQIGVAGQPLPVPPAVIVTDAAGRPAPGITVTFDPLTGTVTGAVQITDAHGIAAVGSWTIVEGTNFLNAVTPDRAGHQFLASGHADVAGTMTVIDGPDADATGGSAQTLRVRLADPAGNPIIGHPLVWRPAERQLLPGLLPGAFRRWHFSGTVEQETVHTNGDGVAENVWTLGHGAGVQKLEVYPLPLNGKGFAGATHTFNVHVPPGPPANYVIWTDRLSAEVGEAVGIRTQLTDAYVNFLEIPGRSVTWGTIGTKGSFSPASSATDAAGVARTTFYPGPTLNTCHRVTATDNGGASGTASNQAVICVGIPPGTELQLMIIVPPSDTATSGVPLSRQPVIEVQDGNGRPLDIEGTIYAAIASGNGLINGPQAIRIVDSRAAFVNLTITGNGPHTLRFYSSFGAPLIVSGTIEVLQP